MPPRWVVVVIVGSWVAVTAQLVRQHVLPTFVPSDAPPFLVELADEAVTPTIVRWEVYRNHKLIGTLKSWTSYRPRDDTFALHTEAKDLELAALKLWRLDLKVTAPRLAFCTVITRQGELKQFHSEGTLSVLDTTFSFTLTGEQQGERFTRHVALDSPFGQTNQTLDPIPPYRGNVLNPLQPHHKLLGLTPGRRWQLPQMDPAGDLVRETVKALLAKNAEAEQQADTLGKLFDSLGPKTLIAEVLADPVTPDWLLPPTACWVIEYREPGGEPIARTWVRVQDGIVLKQEASRRGESLVLIREN